MPVITDAQVVNFANEYLRPIADQLTRIDQNIPIIVAVYNNRDLGTEIEKAGAGSTLDDGSSASGRTKRSGGDIYNMITLLQNLKEFMDVPGRRDVVLGWQVNGLR